MTAQPEFAHGSAPMPDPSSGPAADRTAADAAEPAPPTPDAHHAAAERLVRRYTLGGMAVGLVPVPLVDLAGLVAVQLKMLHGLSRHYGVAFRADLGRSAAASLVGGVLPSALAPTLAASFGKLIPVYGHLIGGSSLALVSGAATYALGKVFIQHFASGGTFLTFDPEAVRDYFEQQLDAGRQVAAELQPGSGRGGRRP